MPWYTFVWWEEDKVAHDGTEVQQVHTIFQEKFQPLPVLVELLDRHGVGACEERSNMKVASPYRILHLRGPASAPACRRWAGKKVGTPLWLHIGRGSCGTGGGRDPAPKGSTETRQLRSRILPLCLLSSLAPKCIDLCHCALHTECLYKIWSARVIRIHHSCNFNQHVIKENHFALHKTVKSTTPTEKTVVDSVSR
jgi:hypothetical protein